MHKHVICPSTTPHSKVLGGPRTGLVLEAKGEVHVGLPLSDICVTGEVLGGPSQGLVLEAEEFKLVSLDL